MPVQNIRSSRKKDGENEGQEFNHSLGFLIRLFLLLPSGDPGTVQAPPSVPEEPCGSPGGNLPASPLGSSPWKEPQTFTEMLPTRKANPDYLPQLGPSSPSHLSWVLYPALTACSPMAPQLECNIAIFMLFGMFLAH